MILDFVGPVFMLFVACEGGYAGSFVIGEAVSVWCQAVWPSW